MRNAEGENNNGFGILGFYQSLNNVQQCENAANGIMH